METKNFTPDVQLFQGLVRYEGSPKADLEEYKLMTIRKYMLSEKLTLYIPELKDKMAVCEEVKSCPTDLEKIAEIFADQKGKGAKIQFSKKTSELDVAEEPLGYLQINLKDDKEGDKQFYYKFRVRPVPDWSGFDGVIAFVDGSSGGKDKISHEGKEYRAFGGAYCLYRDGEEKLFIRSTEAEENPIAVKLKGIKEIPEGQKDTSGNINGELNAAMCAIRRADREGFQKLRLYYDCENIGSFAPGGYFKAKSKIAKDYTNFFDGPFQNLKSIELVHVEAHRGFSSNEMVDNLANEVRDSVKPEFESDSEKKEEYLANKDHEGCEE